MGGGPGVKRTNGWGGWRARGKTNEWMGWVEGVGTIGVDSKTND